MVPNGPVSTSGTNSSLALSRDSSHDIQNPEQGDVTLVTTMGEIAFELYWVHAPKVRHIRCRHFGIFYDSI